MEKVALSFKKSCTSVQKKKKKKKEVLYLAVNSLSQIDPKRLLDSGPHYHSDNSSLLQSPEAFWYFFKVRMFGCMDVVEHPKLASVAMDMAMELNGYLMCFNFISEILKSNIDAHFWSLTLAICRHFKQKNPFVCDPPNQIDPWALTRPILSPTTNRISPGNILIIDMYQTASAQSGAHFLEASTRSDSTAPKMTVKDLMFGMLNLSLLLLHGNLTFDLFKCELKDATESSI